MNNPSKSDSSIVGYLYEKYGESNELWNSLDGIFACVIWDERDGSFVAARDAIGICSLYWRKGSDGSTWFASEMKLLQTRCEWVDCTQDTCTEAKLALSRGGTIQCGWVNQICASLITNWRIPDITLRNIIQKRLSLEDRLMSDAPLAVLLSGGLEFSWRYCFNKGSERR